MKLFLHRNIILENHSVPTDKQPIDEIDDIANSISDNIAKEVRIPKDVLDSFQIKDTLNPDIWTNDTLNPQVRTKLNKIAVDFFKKLNLPAEVKMKDIIFTGSLANYNWSKFSDIDIHIVLDFSQLEGGEQFKEDFFYAQKSLWNQEHDITIHNYPIELYVQDVKAKLTATAVYSVKNNKWILKPKREDFKVNKSVIKNKADKFIGTLKDIKKSYEQNDYQDVVDKVELIKDKIKKYRTAGLEKGGEFSIENMVFKVLRRTPFMDILDSYKAKAYDTLMSVKETMTESRKLIKQRLDEISYGSMYATKSDLARTMARVTNAYQFVQSRPKPELVNYWNVITHNPIEQGFIASAVVDIRGDVQIRTYNAAAGDVRQNRFDLRGEDSEHLVLPISAHPGIDHPNSKQRTGYAVTKGGINNPTPVGQGDFGSPASDAQIKAYFKYGEVIIDFVKSKMEEKTKSYTDGSGAEVSAQAMANNPALQKKKTKKDLEMELGRRITDAQFQTYLDTNEKPEGKGVTSMDADKAAEFEKRQADAIARRNQAMARRNK